MLLDYRSYIISPAKNLLPQKWPGIFNTDIRAILAGRNGLMKLLHDQGDNC